MKYGFIIDNRKCIGCHACTVACKSEHDVPVGVNRTWVKQIEKGEYPNTRRIFSVMRCNHCTNAPCVSICPVEALHVREDGIVDFDNERCIGCKACMQACPYDALYIDPETHTAAKCNYCAPRVDIGLEPACVNVCPEHAIISGDMEDPTSEIYEMLATERVMVRKPEKGTIPNVFYIDGDEASLSPTYTQTSDSYMWSSQSGGVGHFAQYAEAKQLKADKRQMEQTLAKNGNDSTHKKTQIQAIVGKARRVYDAPSKGTLWGWEVSAYVWTKAVSAGALLMLFLANIFDFAFISELNSWLGIAIGMIFLMATGVLLVRDLDQPARFIYILLRPQWHSWLVRGGYVITIYGGMITLLAISKWVGWTVLENISLWGAGIFAAITAVYTAFLFAQAKARDFWQSPVLPFHMLTHSFMAGAATFALIAGFTEAMQDWSEFLLTALYISLGFNLSILFFELAIPHPTSDAKMTAEIILKGKYKRLFWMGTVLLGNIIPIILLAVGSGLAMIVAAICVLIGIYITEHIWVQAPQQIPLS